MPAVLSRRIASPLKWHGGKHYLASKIVSLMPPHLHYVEPYAGGLSVLLAKDPEGVSEVVNDLHGDLTNFWAVLQGRDTFDDFCRTVEAIPFSEPEWLAARDGLGRSGGGDPIARAVRFFVHCRQSHAARMREFTALTRTRVRRKMNAEASAWLTAVDGLPAVHARLRRVVVLNRNAIDVIRQQDSPETLFYLDPPYLHETRASPGVYTHEMDTTRHNELLAVIRECTGRVMLSGYSSGLYVRGLSDWTRHEFALPNQAAGGKRKRRMVEVVWCNF